MREQINDFFHRDEFECKCGCGFDAVDIELLVVLSDVRLHFNTPVIITGGNRCKKHNKREGGAKRSQHIFAKACDFKVVDINPNLVYEYLEEKYPNKFGIGRYSGRTHIDVRLNRTRWDNR
jgi:uncharacterized protein YcbK (DUF882 family)